MRYSFRVAAFAAAVSGLCAAGVLAGPSLASESGEAPAVSYIDHAAAAFAGEALDLPDLADTIETARADAAAPVATHAGAPVLPAPVPAARPAEERDGRSLAELVADYAAAEAADEETDCLARAVYYEAKGEPLAGQLSVAEVILNRTESGRFPSSICGVVRQPGQFSFVRRGHIPRPPAGSRDWRVAVAIARIALDDLADGAAPRALFFHARHVRPGWRHTRVAAVGNHIFYR